MTTSESTFKQLTQEVARLARLDPHKIEPNAHFIVDFGMSSLDVLCVLAYAETNFAMKFSNEHLGELTTLNNVIEAVRNSQSEQTRKQI
jgi:acyl carrier protein